MKCSKYDEEQAKLIEISANLPTLSKDGKAYREAMEEIYRALAYPEESCQDKSFDLEFWKMALKGADLALILIAKINTAVQHQIAGATMASFR